MQEELKRTFIEEYTSARMLKDMDRMKSSVVLLSKSLFAICDLLIVSKYGRLPKNHSERFRILQLKEPEIYAQVDLVWSRYTDTYSKPSDEESFKMLNTAIMKVAENEGIDKEIKPIVKG